ncbi:MAG: PPOX class F420-dependent oxidoreductase [Acidimicrobiales bacterium]
MGGIVDEKYVSLTSYKKDGSTKSLPVWIVDVGDSKVGFTTFSSSYKVKRLLNDARVTLQPCNSKGVPTAGSETHAGSAEVVSGAEFEAVRAKIKAKYGFQFHIVNTIGKISKLIGKASGTDRAIVITFD